MTRRELSQNQIDEDRRRWKSELAQRVNDSTRNTPAPKAKPAPVPVETRKVIQPPAPAPRPPRTGPRATIDIPFQRAKDDAARAAKEEEDGLTAAGHGGWYGPPRGDHVPGSQGGEKDRNATPGGSQTGPSRGERPKAKKAAAAKEPAKKLPGEPGWGNEHNVSEERYKDRPYTNVRQSEARPLIDESTPDVRQGPRNDPRIRELASDANGDYDASTGTQLYQAAQQSSLVVMARTAVPAPGFDREIGHEIRPDRPILSEDAKRNIRKEISDRNAETGGNETLGAPGSPTFEKYQAHRNNADGTEAAKDGEGTGKDHTSRFLYTPGTSDAYRMDFVDTPRNHEALASEGERTHRRAAEGVIKSDAMEQDATKAGDTHTVITGQGSVTLARPNISQVSEDIKTRRKSAATNLEKADKLHPNAPERATLEEQARVDTRKADKLQEFADELQRSGGADLHKYVTTVMRPGETMETVSDADGSFKSRPAQTLAEAHKRDAAIKHNNPIHDRIAALRATKPFTAAVQAKIDREHAKLIEVPQRLGKDATRDAVTRSMRQDMVFIESRADVHARWIHPPINPDGSIPVNTLKSGRKEPGKGYDDNAAAIHPRHLQEVKQTPPDRDQMYSELKGLGVRGGKRDNADNAHNLSQTMWAVSRLAGSDGHVVQDQKGLNDLMGRDPHQSTQRGRDLKALEKLGWIKIEAIPQTSVNDPNGRTRRGKKNTAPRNPSHRIIILKHHTTEELIDYTP